MSESEAVRTASCCCGDTSITVIGNPERVIACHCDYCQKRTGSVFQLSCWFKGEHVREITGNGVVYRGPENVGLDYTFCPKCGSTVYWKFAVMEEAMGISVYGIAVGNFADPDFPAPDLEVWTNKKHHWVNKVLHENSYPEDAPWNEMSIE
jgi:hypothetical protein